MRTVTRFRPDPLTSFALAAVAAGFLSGAMAGTAATLALITPAAVERCNAAPDPIACLIITEQESEPKE